MPLGFDDAGDLGRKHDPGRQRGRGERVLFEQPHDAVFEQRPKPDRIEVCLGGSRGGGGPVALRLFRGCARHGFELVVQELLWGGGSEGHKGKGGRSTEIEIGRESAVEMTPKYEYV